MIDWKKVQFSSTEDPQRPWLTMHIAMISLSSSVTIDRGHCMESGDKVKTTLIEVLNHSIYGDLRKPLLELADLALFSSRTPDEAGRAQKLGEELLKLISPP